MHRLIILLSITFHASLAFVTPRIITTVGMRLMASTDEDKVAKSVTGEELELMLQDLDLPLVVDAYATWW